MTELENHSFLCYRASDNILKRQVAVANVNKQDIMLGNCSIYCEKKFDKIFTKQVDLAMPVLQDAMSSFNKRKCSSIVTFSLSKNVVHNGSDFDAPLHIVSIRSKTTISFTNVLFTCLPYKLLARRALFLHVKKKARDKKNQQRSPPCL